MGFATQGFRCFSRFNFRIRPPPPAPPHEGEGRRASWGGRRLVRGGAHRVKLGRARPSPLPSLTLPPIQRLRAPEFPGGPCFRSFAFCKGSPSASALRPQVSFRFGLGNTPPPPPFGAEPSQGCADVDAALCGANCKVWGVRPAGLSRVRRDQTARLDVPGRSCARAFGGHV
jgi:hypothetical protein